MGASNTQRYPQGTIKLDGSSRAFERLDPYQQRRLQRLAGRGVKDAAIDEHGDVHALLNGSRVTIRRHARQWAQAYWGVTLAVWLQLLTSVHPTVVGYTCAAAAQLIVHEAWPRKFRRHKKSVGDHAADRLQRVL